MNVNASLDDKEKSCQNRKKKWSLSKNGKLMVSTKPCGPFKLNPGKKVDIDTSSIQKWSSMPMFLKARLFLI